MNLNAYIELEKKRLAELLASDKPVFYGAQASLVKMSRRVFLLGKNADGSRIGSYSEKDIWLNPEKMAVRNKKGFVPLKGKRGNTEFKSDPTRKRKTSYFEGWKGFRETQGLRTGFINLTYTGDLKSDVENARPGQYPEPIKVSEGKWKVAIERADNIEKYKGWTEALKFNAEEIKEYYRIAELEFRKLFIK
jgi:hypothetical protein